MVVAPLWGGQPQSMYFLAGLHNLTHREALFMSHHVGELTLHLKILFNEKLLD